MKALSAPVDRAVDIHHRRHALVDILGGVVLHVVVEPLAAHRLAPVAPDLDDTAFAVWITGANVGGVRVDRVVTGQDQRPAIVIELAGKEKGCGVAIAFGRVMAVVMMRCQGMPAEAIVGGWVERKKIVMPEHGGNTHTRLQKLGRHGAVEGPNCIRLLNRHRRVEADCNVLCRTAEMVEAARLELSSGVSVALPLIPHSRVAAPASCRGHEIFLRAKFVPALMRIPLALWSPFGRTVGNGADALAYLGEPGICRDRIGFPRGKREQRLLAQE